MTTDFDRDDIALGRSVTVYPNNVPSEGLTEGVVIQVATRRSFKPYVVQMGDEGLLGFYHADQIQEWLPDADPCTS